MASSAKRTFKLRELKDAGNHNTENNGIEQNYGTDPNLSVLSL